MNISLGYSPCPNDSFIFYGLASKRIAPDINWDIRLLDVEALNQLAKTKVLDLSKISYHAYGHFAKDYIILPAGGALGKGVGPLIVSKHNLPNLNNKTVPMRYDKIMPAVANEEVDAGLIIHESRFTFAEYGLKQYLDLGEWWENETGHLLPLGAIMAKRTLGVKLLRKINTALKDSIAYAYKHRIEAQPYIAKHATEMSELVMQKHIDLYVNDYSIDLGKQGKAAVIELFARAQSRGIIPKITEQVFLD